LCDQVPKEGIFENVNTLEDLLKMPEWTEERPLRVVTGFGYVGSFTQAV
jgi:ATP phosphoribosyltransferase